ncbi:MAG: GDSL-type esterase/lipase family protein [Polyangiaceae bacterium]
MRRTFRPSIPLVAAGAVLAATTVSGDLLADPKLAAGSHGSPDFDDLDTNAVVPSLGPGERIVSPSEARVPPAPQVPIERASALRPFFQRLREIEGAATTRDVRVLVYGDSHTQPDIATDVVRQTLAARFGDGGRGFLHVVKPYKTYLQTQAKLVLPPSWTIERGKSERGGFVGDGHYGLGGSSAKTTRRGDALAFDVAAPSSRIEIAFLEQPGGGSFDLVVDGVPRGRVATSRVTLGSGFRSVDVGHAAHHVEFVPRGDGEVRIFGLALDRPEVGVTVDALGIGGARASGMLNWDAAHFAEQIRHRAPDLVVLAFGTNESGFGTSDATYEKQLRDVLGRIVRSAPNAGCLLLGPPDWSMKGRDGERATPSKLFEVIATQRRIAGAYGCAYYGQLEAMGGPGSMELWASVEPPLARKDRVHMTKAGYERLGAGFAGELLRTFDLWKATSH